MNSASWEDLSSFASKLHKSRLSVPEQAEAILWFRFRCQDADTQGLTPMELADLMDSHHLCNHSEAFKEVYALQQRSRFIIMDSGKGGLVINFRERDFLDEKYESLLESPPERRVSYELVTPIDIFESSSFASLFHQLLRQANVCYEFDLLDACALVCRHLIELLLIKAFDAHSRVSVIQDSNGDYVGLGAIIGHAKSGTVFPLDEDTKAFLEAVYRAGNDAAHCQIHPLKKKEIDRFKPLMDKGLSELLDRAKIKRK